MRKFLSLCLLILCSSFASLAQKAQIIDSLEIILNTQRLTPIRQLGIYDTICRMSMNYDLEKLMKYAKDGLLLAQKENDKLNIWNFYENIAIGYSMKGSYDTALIYFNSALDLAVKSKDPSHEGSTYEGMGIIYWQQKKYLLSLEYFLRALSIFEQIGNKKQSVSLLGNLGSIHHALKNYDKAIYYSEKSRILAEELNDTYKSILAYYNLGLIYLDKKEYEKALDYELKVLEMSRTYNSKNFEIISLQALSNIYSNGFDDNDKALEYLNESIKMDNDYGDPATTYYSLCLLSDIYRKQGKWRKSEETALKALNIDSTNMDGSTGLVLNVIVSGIHLGNKDKAESFLWKYKDLNEKYIDKNYREIMADMEVKYETEKKEMRIAILENERKLYIGLSIAVATILLLSLGLLFYRHRLSVQKQKIAEQQIKQLGQEKELIATRSALDAEKSEREIIARDLHDGVGAMLSVVKNNMDIMKSFSIIENTEAEYFYSALDILDKSIIELRRVAHHIMPSTLMNSGLTIALNDFCRSIPEVEFHFAEPNHRFDQEKELVLYRCAYELINNALRHSKASQIDVHLNIDEQTIYLSVVDNGCGFDPQTANIGMGINNMRSRLNIFNGRMDIYSDRGKGTEVNIELDL